MFLRPAVSLPVLALAGAAAASHVLPLGPGTACTLTSQREARKTLGVHGRQHVLTCASPTGTIVHVYVTRAGQVACSERLQVARDGQMTPIGASCHGGAGGTTAPKAQDTSEPINLTGNWSVDTSAGSCTVTVVQDGDQLSLNGDCPGNGTITGSGTISFTDQAFTTEGPASGSIAAVYCPGETVRLAGRVSPDGQVVDGTVTCGSYRLSFQSRRIN